MTRKSVVFTAIIGALTSLSAHGQNLLPKPQSYVAGKGVFDTSATSFKIVNEVGTTADNIYSREWLQRHDKNATQVVRYARLNNASSPEAYRLHVTKDSVVIYGTTPDSFRFAWQTIRQLTTKKGILCCDVDDAPAYKWRSLMLDVSRHFFPISFLKKQVDIMAQYKFNRFHIHLTDAAGWRIEIKRYPRLTNFAAWRPEASWKEWGANGARYVEEGTPGAYGGYYTQDELRDLVRYAADRGITIVPEIEIPGHSEEVMTAYPELSCTHEPYKQSDFCPGNIATYDFMENVLKEVMDIFPSEYIHVGGDEAAKKSWPDCPLCQKKMKELGIDNVDGLQANLIAHFGKFLSDHGRQLVGWDEVIAGNLSSNTTVMVWRGVEYASEAIKHGYNVVLSPGGYCYLDGYQDAPQTQPEAIGGYLTTEKVYSYVPGEDLSDDMKAKITGVQGNLWCEYVPTEEHAEYMLYPRALAIAEIGWNGTKTKDYPDFRRRAIAEIEVLRGKGVHPFDLKNEVGERKLSLAPMKHKAVGCKVTYNSPMNNAYKAQGETTLTDGHFGGWAFGDRRWQGFIGKGNCLDVTVDLGKRQKVSSVATEFMQSCGPEIYFPGEYVVSLSDNGSDFTEVYSQSYEAVKTAQPEYKFLTWKGAKQARYVRVQAKASIGWVFADEIVVK